MKNAITKASRTMSPIISLETFTIEINKPSVLKPGTFYWSQVGLTSKSIKDAKTWLQSDFNIFKEQPNIKYRVTKTTYFERLTEIVEEGIR